MSPELLKVILGLVEINAEWTALAPAMERIIRGKATAHELQVVAEKLEELPKRAKELHELNDRLIAASK
jgi:hypothetical protein